MGLLTVQGAVLNCTFGSAPGTMKKTGQTTCMADGKPVAVIQDTAPGINITPFAMCSSMLNPQVAAATSAAMGVLTPQPCQPVAAGTWIPVKEGVLAGGIPCLCSDSTLTCTTGMGIITIKSPGQTKVIV